jgi:hypothetical protein
MNSKAVSPQRHRGSQKQSIAFVVASVIDIYRIKNATMARAARCLGVSVVSL